MPGVTLNITSDYQGANISSLTSANYDVCMLSANSTQPSTVGSQINLFAAAGGGLVITVFANSSVPVTNLLYSTYTPITSASGVQNLSSSLNTASIVTHPITTGLSSTSFSAGGSYSSVTVSLNSGAQSIASYAQGTSVIAIQEVAL